MKRFLDSFNQKDSTGHQTAVLERAEVAGGGFSLIVRIPLPVGRVVAMGHGFPFFLSLFLALLCGFQERALARPTPFTENPTRGLHKAWLIDAPRSAVWWSWTTAEGLKTFLAPDAKVELELGGTYEFYLFPDAPPGERGNEGCTVLSYVPQEVLSFTWNAPTWFGPELRETFTFVVLRFEEVGEQTLLTFDQLGFPEGDRWNELIAYFDRGWELQIAKLREALLEEAVWSSESEGRSGVLPGLSPGIVSFPVGSRHPPLTDPAWVTTARTKRTSSRRAAAPEPERQPLRTIYPSAPPTW